MKNTLLERLLSFYEEEPGDPFNIYALALEYLKSNQLQASKYFDKLLNEHPDYLATYYHAGEFFAQREEVEKAREIYLKGIALAQSQGNQKTHSELTRAYRSFLDELEDY
jgi:tetratricopeptide (TPR) repeat protein